MSTPPRGGRPFQSKLEPHFDLIARLRRSRKTWAEIADEIGRQGTKCTPQGVCIFLKRRRRRRYALGMEPEGYASAPNATLPPSAAASLRPASASALFDLLVDEAEAATCQQQKKRSVTVIRPKPGTPL